MSKIVVKNSDFAEYETKTELKGKKSRYCFIPECIIFDEKNAGYKIGILSYMKFFMRDFDEVTSFSFDKIKEWNGCFTKNKTKDSSRTIIKNTLIQLKKDKYLDFDEKELVGNQYLDAKNNLELIKEKVQGESLFAILYCDEVETILNYKLNMKKEIDNKELLESYLDGELTNGFTDNYTIKPHTVLQVFAYLKMMIPKRRNESYTYIRAYDKRKFYIPEVYDCYYQDIAQKLNLSDNIVSYAIQVLKDLNLIHIKTLPRKQYRKPNGDIGYKTQCTLFCFTYKREGNYLLASGKDYYENEIINKISRLKELGVISVEGGDKNGLFKTV